MPTPRSLTYRKEGGVDIYTYIFGMGKREYWDQREVLRTKSVGETNTMIRIGALE